MQKLILIGLAIVALPSFAAGDLWFSVLSLPPGPKELAFGMYVHCPTAHHTAMVDLYEIKSLKEKKRLAEFEADIVDGEGSLSLVAIRDTKEKLRLSIDRSKSLAVAPYNYRAYVTLDPTIYQLTKHQATISARTRNPNYPKIGWQPVWNDYLSYCD